MEQVEDYERRARECRVLAERAEPHHRENIAQIAATWTKLANERRRMLENKAVQSKDQK